MYAFTKIETIFVPFSLKKLFFRFVEVNFHLEAKLSVHFTQVATLKCTLYRGNFMKPKFLSALAECLR